MDLLPLFDIDWQKELLAILTKLIASGTCYLREILGMD